jgi:transcription elongation factor GreA
MSDQESYLSREKFEELRKELDFLKTVKRKEIAENLEYARSLGDLSENSEYQEARELQAATEERIQKLEGMLKSVKIVGNTKSDIVGMGSKVIVQKESETETHKYQIVGSEEADMLQGKLSYQSPLGAALMEKKKGDAFSFTTPKGKMNYKIIEIS